MSSSTVYVVGSINEDVRIEVERHALPGETVSARDMSHGLGGKGANQAVGAARAGAPVRFIGAIGDDEAGIRQRAALGEDGIDTTFLPVAPGTATGAAFVFVADSGENQITIVSGANLAIADATVVDGLAEASAGDVLLLQLEVPLDTVRLAARTAREHGATVVLNAAPMHDGVLDLLADVDVLVVNEHELKDLLAAATADADADAGVVRAKTPVTVDDLIARHDLAILSTLGSEGSNYRSRDDDLAQAAFRVAAVDTTGAGDTFIGYAAAVRAAGGDWAEALRTASLASAITVTRAGSARSVPHRADVERARGELSESAAAAAL